MYPNVELLLRSANVGLASADNFSKSGLSTLVGEVPGLEEILGLEVTWTAFLYRNR